MTDNENADCATTNELVEAVNSNLLETVIDLSQIDLKAALLALTGEDSLLAEIPVLKWMISGVRITSHISAIHSIRKFSSFIKPVKDSTIFENEDCKRKLVEICGSQKKLDFVIEQTLFSLDKYDSEIKAKWLAKLFISTFKDKIFSVEEYNAIQFSINSLNPITSIKTLESYYKYYKERINNGNIDEEQEQERLNTDFSSLVLSGFLSLPHGGTYSALAEKVSINDLGVRFYENVIIE